MYQKQEQYLTPEEVKEFQTLVFETKGIRLTEEEALDQGTRLIMLMESMQKFKPIQLSYKDAVELKPKRRENTRKI